MKKKSFLKPVLLGLGLLVLGIVIGLAFFAQPVATSPYGASSADISMDASPGGAPGEYVVSKEQLAPAIEVSGNILPVREQDFKAPGDGLITEVFVKEGQAVPGGMLLGSLDASREQFELKQQQFAIDQELFSGNVRRVELLREEYKVKEEAIAKRRFTSRFPGKISQVGGKAGDFLRAGDLFVRVIDTTSLRAKVELVEADVPWVKVGQKVRFTFPAVPGVHAEGFVKSLGTEGRINQRGLPVLDAELLIPLPPVEVIPPFSFVGEIETGESGEVLVLDALAVFQEEGQTKVRMAGSAEVRHVEVVALAGGKVRVLSGLAEGDRVQAQALSPMEGMGY